jgi:hypothetical protein
VTTKTKLEGLRLPDLWQRYTAATGGRTRTPNKAYLVKAILEAEKGKQRTARKAPGQPQARGPAAAVADVAPKRGRFAGMTVEQLRALYEEKVGRPTDSVDEAYLKWKIREAEKGRVSVGPALRRRRDEPVVAVTLRFGKSELERIDRVLERAGAKNRTRFFMQAIGGQLAALGENELGREVAGVTEA